MNTTLARYRWVGWAVPFFAFCAFAHAALVITTQPASQYANLGSNVSFSVSATATSAITYQWQFNGQNLAGANSSTLSITNVQAYQGGTYSVAMTGDGVTLNSINAQLSVVSPPTISGQPPANTTAVIGFNFYFSPGIDGTYPVTYQWKKDGSVLTGETSSYLSINNVTAASAGSYTLTATNGAGSVTTNPAVVTVVNAISITSQPTSQTVDAGASVSLSVTATGPGTLEYAWSKEGNVIPGATSSSLSLTNVTSTNSGTYSVNVRNVYQSFGISSNTATVAVKAAPVIRTQPPASATATVGSSLNLSVSAVGAEPLTYQWRKDGVPLPMSSRYQGTDYINFWIYQPTTADAGTYSVVITNPYGSVTSQDSVVTVSANPNGPTITMQPASQSTPVGGVVTFSVTATGPSWASTPTYQWQKAGVAIVGALSSNYTIPSVGAGDAGDYSVIVTNNYSFVTSTVAHLTVTAAAGIPSITQHPNSQNTRVGQNVTLTVAASGSPAPSYQWYKDGVSIPGATSPNFALNNVQTSDSGSYTAIASNVAGSAVSSPAILGVNAVVQTRVINLSARAQVGINGDVLIAGFIINGSTPKKMLIRAVGPTLSRFGVDGLLANPFLRVVTLIGGETVASNDDWSITDDLPGLLATQARIGAFPLSENSKDAALLVTLAPGAYTAVVSGVTNTTGVALAEIWEVDNATPNQLINISARAFVGTGAKVLIPGIIVTGETPKKFLVRAIGPGLSQFSVPGVLANPKLEVVNSAGQTIAANDDWSISENLAETQSVSQSLNVFPLGQGSKDAVAVVTLAPGNHTIVVQGVGSTTGVALVEVYQVP